jgi:hypothetical protein
MSDLETECRSTIGALIRDISINLDRQRKNAIARWATKTAMVGETISRSSRAFFYRQAEREQLRDSVRFPPFTEVYLGRYVGKYELGFYALDSWDKKPTASDVSHVYTSTILLGRLVMQVITIHPPAENPKSFIKLQWARLQPWEIALFRLGPLDGRILTWPPQVTLTDAGNLPLKDLVERASGYIPTSPIPPPF